MHSTAMRPFRGPGRQHPRPDPVPAPAAGAANDAVPMTKVGRQIPLGDPRVHQAHNLVQEAAEVGGLAGADFGVLVQWAVHGLEFDVAKRVARHGIGP